MSEVDLPESCRECFSHLILCSGSIKRSGQVVAICAHSQDARVTAGVYLADAGIERSPRVMKLSIRKNRTKMTNVTIRLTEED